MSGRMRRVKLANGEQYDVPEENADAFMQELDGAGLAFSSDGYAPDGDTSEPPPPTAPAGSEAPPGPPEGAGEGKTEPDSPWLRYVEMAVPQLKAARYFASPEGRQTAYDAVGGALHGASSGLGDDALDLVSPDLGDQARAQWAASQARSPTAYAAGDIVGSALSPINKLGGAVGLGAGAGVARNVAGQALTGGVQGALRSYGDAPEGMDQRDAAMAALAQGGKDAAISGAVTGALAIPGAVASGLGAVSDKARAAAIGGTASDYRKLADKYGMDYVEGDLGRIPEQLGVTNTIVPQSASGYARRLADVKGESGAQIGQALDDAAQQLEPGFVDKDALLAEMAAAQRQAAGGPLGNRDAQAAALGRVADAMGDQTVQTPADLRALKSTYEAQAYPDALAGSNESLMGQAHKTAADITRGQLRDAMSYTLPETQSAFNQGNQRYGQAAILGEMAQNRAAGNMAQTGPMMTGMLGSAGAALGALASHGDYGGALLGAAAAKPMFNAARDYGPDAIANVTRLGERGMAPVGAASDWISQNAPIGGLTAAADPGEQALSSMANEHAKIQGEARGYLLPQAVKQAVQSGQLGPYTQLFASLDDDADIAATIQRLRANDPQFARQYLPLLNQMTAER